MRGKLGIWIGTIFAVIVLGLLVFTAQGAPSPPGITLNQQYNPSTTATVIIHVESELYGFQSSNSVALFGANFIVTVTQGTTVLVYQQRIAANFYGYADPGNPFSAQIIAGTESVSVPAACSGSVCPYEQLTVSAYATVQTYTVAWVSPTSTYNFTNSATSTGSSPGSADYSSYSLEFWTPLLLLFAIVFWVVYFTDLSKHPAVALVAIALTVALAAETSIAASIVLGVI